MSRMHFTDFCLYKKTCCLLSSAFGLLHDELKHIQIILLEGQISRMDCMLPPVYGGLFLDKVLLAGLDLNTQGSFLNGLTPLRATVARFFFNFMLWTPQTLNNSSLARQWPNPRNCSPNLWIQIHFAIHFAIFANAWFEVRLAQMKQNKKKNANTM